MGDSEVIAGLGTKATWVRAAPNAAQRNLGTEEQALLRAIGQGAVLRDVLERCGLPEPKAIALLLGMRLKGIVQPMAAPPPGAQQPPPAPVRPAAHVRPPTPPPTVPKPAVIDSKALEEQVDLDEQRKKEILELESRLQSDHFFALLGVPPGSTPDACKKAYYEATKRFHPDRYFGKKIGSYKERIEKIFRRLTEAQGTLSDPVKRKAYLAQHPALDVAPPAPTPPPRATPPASASPRQPTPVPPAVPGRQPTLRPTPPPVAAPQVDPELAKERAAERRARLAKHPYLAKAGKLHELLARGKENLSKGEYAKAYTDLSLAAQIDPQNQEIASLMAKAKKEGDVRRAESEGKEAAAAEKMGDTSSALTHLRNAVSLAPDNADFAFRAARILLNGGREADLKEAHILARKAAELAPRNVDHHLTFARVLLRAGLDKNAVREYEIVLKLDPENETAKEQMKKLKWKI